MGQPSTKTQLLSNSFYNLCPPAPPPPPPLTYIKLVFHLHKQRHNRGSTLHVWNDLGRPIYTVELSHTRCTNEETKHDLNHIR